MRDGMNMLLETIFNVIGTWFGYVATCVASPLPTCLPFVAFLALGSAAFVFLALVLTIYRSAQEKDLRAIREKRASVRAGEIPKRVSRTGVQAAVRQRPLSRRRWSAAL